MPLLVALGSNAPQPGQTAEDVVSKAFEAMAAEGLQVVLKCALYRTPGFPAGAGPDYVNAAAVLHSEQPAAAVMAVLHRIEDTFGRERVQRWGMRVLDLDLLADFDRVIAFGDNQIIADDTPAVAIKSYVEAMTDV